MSADQVLIILATARAAEQGKSLQEVKNAAEAATRHMQVFFTVETLEFLHRGGRINGASPFLGTALDFKPILTFNTEGKIDALERVRTNKKVIKRILTLAEEAANGQPVHAAVVHASIFQTADQLRLEALNCLNSLDMVTVEFSLVIGVHLGPGSVGIALYADSA